MTHPANMSFKGTFEARVKNALAVCYRRAHFEQDATRHCYGVEVAVRVVGQAWPKAPEPEAKAVADHVEATASYIEKVGDAAPDASAAPPPGAPALPAGTVSVSCIH